MRSLRPFPAFILSVGLTLLQQSALQAAPSLTFEQRVEAQRAIERVRYAHQIGARRAFDEAVPQAVLEARVRAYLEQSALLEQDWSTPITTAMLRDEAARITRDTRMPDRLRELYEALGDDPFLIEECLVRPALAGRLIQQLTTGASTEEIGTPSLAAMCDPEGVWDNRSLGMDNPGPWAGGEHVAVWTGTQMLVWVITAGTGGSYDPVLDTWSLISSASAPGPSDISGPAAAWSGQELLLWGAQSKFGARYDPLADSWTSMSTTGAPSRRHGSTSVWAGDRLIIWGGWDEEVVPTCCVNSFCANCNGQVSTGGMYNPVTDSWTPTSTTNAPRAEQASAVWTGSRMIVFGGHTNHVLAFAGLFKPIANFYGPGGIYDPVANHWAPLPAYIGGRDSHVAAWAGDRMLIWGGITTAVFQNGGFVTNAYHDGAAYDPASGIWSQIPAPGTPLNCCKASSVWTDRNLIVWGGSLSGNDGALYDPTLNAWSPTSLASAPEARTGSSAVWDGAGMIVWGGASSNYLSTGGRYVPPDPDDSTDADQDGFTHCAGDCNESNPAINPGAPETCDLADNDCDGLLPADEVDADGDGFSLCLGDCLDSDPTVLPGGIDLPGNALDEDCSGAVLCDPGAVWPRHNIYVRCVSDACVTLVDEGLVSKEECQALIRTARRSDVGRQPHTTRTPTPVEP